MRPAAFSFYALMVFHCLNSSCKATFTSRTSLNQHRRHCQYEELSTISNATEKYEARKARKRQKLDTPSGNAGPLPDPALDMEITGDVLMQSPASPAPLALPSESLECPTGPPVEPEPLGRSFRKKRPTWKVLQSLPDPLPSVPPPIVDSQAETTAEHDPNQPPSVVWKAIQTVKDCFGVYREYPHAPSHNPDTYHRLRDGPDKPTSGGATTNLLTLPSQPIPELPPSLVSPTVSGFLQWMWTGSATKSIAEVSKLISFLKSDAFKKEDLQDFDIRKDTAKLDAWLDRSTPPVPKSTPPELDSRAPSAKSNGRKKGAKSKDTSTAATIVDNALPEPHEAVLSASGDDRATKLTPMSTSSKATTIAEPCTRPSEAAACKMDPKDSWRKLTVEIQVPDGKPHSSFAEIPIFPIPGLQLRSLVQVVKSVFANANSLSFHYTPFKKLWSSPTCTENPPVEERIYDEIFSSDAMLEAHAQVHKLPAEKFQGEELERVVAAMMFWSDSTHLANFGNASLWPIYMFFGNQAKEQRAQPNSSACHHVAYMPKLPDTFNDWFRSRTNKAPDSDILAHCRRELIHQVWQLLLDDEFMHAYEHGIVIKCPDGKHRRFYPRIFTYSADYPEKVLLATIRTMGGCPCPRCLLPKDKIFEMGRINDEGRRTRMERNSKWEHDNAKTARTWVYADGDGVKSAAVERLLQPKSLVPTLNAFAKLLPFFFSIHKALVVDLMHEFELGVWKALFVHLVRILHSLGASVVQELNRRYRLVPSFGASGIRRFSEDAASMKKMAARNFEDLLQCAIPVFEGLLPEPHNTELLSLLYTIAEWHTLAKLRLHTSSTLALLREATSHLGRMLRRFRSFTCPSFLTKELPSEVAKRQRQAARKNAKGSPNTEKTQKTSKAEENKYFSLSTYKLHALGDYVSTIQWFGTTDSYSTQPGELEHKRAKKFYGRTNKKDATDQMTRLERREHFLSRLPPLPSPPAKQTSHGNTTKKSHCSNAHELPLGTHFNTVADSENDKVHVAKFLWENLNDPAMKDFLPKLKRHLLWRITNPGFTLSDENASVLATEYNKVNILDNQLYAHKTLRVNYTTYDLRRAQDFLSVTKHANIMCLSRNEDSVHPFEYAQVLRLFHVVVTHQVPGGAIIPQSFNVLFVRRYRVDPSYRAGFKRKRLHRVQFLPHDDPQAFDFVDPDNVIRAAHLIPAFSSGTTTSLLQGESMARAQGRDYDWLYFYVNIFADRDMYMRFRGGGVGHYQVPLPDDDEEFELPSEAYEGLADIVASEVLAEEDGVSSDEAPEDADEEDDEDADENGFGE